MVEDCEWSTVYFNNSRFSEADLRNLEMSGTNQLPNNGEFLTASGMTNGGRVLGLSLLPEIDPFQVPQSNTYRAGIDGRQNLAMLNTNGHVNGGGGGHIYGLPSLSETHSFRFSQPENNTYYPGVDGRQSPAMMNTNGGGNVNTVDGGQIYGLPSLTENNPFQVPPPEINTYNPSVDGRQTLSMMNTNGRHVNPSVLDLLYDYPLESKFNLLSLSTNPPTLTAPPYNGLGAAVGGGVGGGRIVRNNSLADFTTLGMPPYSESQFPYGDLQRMRIQSAARGLNMDLYTQPRNYSTLEDGFDEIGLQYNRYLTRPPRTAHRNASLLPPGYGSQPNLNRNGYRLDNNGSIEPNYSSLIQSRLRSSFSSLEDMRGNIFSVAKDQHGCRFLQRKIEEGKPEDIQMIFFEVQDHLFDLMINQFGNCLIQKLFEVCNQEQMNELLILAMQDERILMDICLDIHGTRAMQKLLEHLTSPEQKTIAISGISRITVPLTKSLSGHHVIQHCLKFFSNEDNKHILNAVADNCLDIATDKSGCCVIQQCVAHAQGEPWDRLVQEITVNALVLSVHPYGYEFYPHRLKI
ncbi:pumilio-like protein 12-like [Forsythia ovata]|uniref:Pumilio-like protein 12-like n=1 Tax=Forsythia ovata TaxID=205694 RepID=A0ABD1WRM5_9LAMI